VRTQPVESSGVECTLSAELAAAGRWSYGNERCVGASATVLLHSCVRSAIPPPLGSNQSECGDWEELTVTLAAVDG
jgi:hypothetical protein